MPSAHILEHLGLVQWAKFSLFYLLLKAISNLWGNKEDMDHKQTMNIGLLNFCKTFSKVLSKFPKLLSDYIYTKQSNPKNGQFWQIKSITSKKAAINMQIQQTMLNTNFSYLASKKLCSTFTVSKAGCFRSLKILHVL